MLAGTGIVVFGIYKSGTTGLFYKIRNSLPPGTRTLFEPRVFEPAEGDRDRVVLAKVILGVPTPEHAVDYASFLTFRHRIYLTRDPRDWIISGALFLLQQERAIYGNEEKVQRVLALLRRKEEDPRSIGFLEVFAGILAGVPDRTLAGVLDWVAALHRWLFAFERTVGGAARVRYEDFVDGRLQDLERRLGLPLPGSAAVDPEHGHVPRTLGHGNWRHWFLPADVAVLRPRFQAYLDRYGYGADWSGDPDPRIDPEHCSRYAERVIRRRRGG